LRLRRISLRGVAVIDRAFYDGDPPLVGFSSPATARSSVVFRCPMAPAATPPLPLQVIDTPFSTGLSP
jgi:hypothetical protein